MIETGEKKKMVERAANDIVSLVRPRMSKCGYAVMTSIEGGVIARNVGLEPRAIARAYDFARDSLGTDPINATSDNIEAVVDYIQLYKSTNGAPTDDQMQTLWALYDLSGPARAGCTKCANRIMGLVTDRAARAHGEKEVSLASLGLTDVIPLLKRYESLMVQHQALLDQKRDIDTDILAVEAELKNYGKVAGKLKELRDLAAHVKNSPL